MPQAQYLLVGAPGAVEGEPACAYVYPTTPRAKPGRRETFTLEVQLTNSSRQVGDQFAAAVAASEFQNGSWSLVGVAEDSGAGLVGGGYLYVHGEPAPSWMDTPDPDGILTVALGRR